MYIYTYIYLYIYTCIYVHINNKVNDGEKVNLFNLKFKVFILIIYKINKYLKSVFTRNAFKDFFISVKVL